jgi:molybdenum cofactor guanylyltransferase
LSGFSPRSDWTGALLVGGRSRRMGVDKLRLTLPDGERLVDHPAAALRATCGHLLAIDAAGGAAPRLEGFSVVPDSIPDIGPAASLLTALQYATTPWVLLLAGDMPQVGPHFLRRLQDLAEEEPGCALLAESPHGLEPTLAAYPKSLLSVVQARVLEGQRALRHLIPQTHRRTWPFSDLQATSSQNEPLCNLNNPQDWQTFTGQALPEHHA